MQQTRPTDTEGVHERIVTGVAALEGVDPMELPPLFDAIDPDALDAIFAATGTGGPRSGCIGFTYADHRVTVEFDDAGDVVVTIE